MPEPIKKDRKSNKEASSHDVELYVAGLSKEHQMLVVLKSQLYGGSWEPMLDDLRNRLEGKPYIFKLINRINDDIDRIEEMRSFESEHGVDLSEYIDKID